MRWQEGLNPRTIALGLDRIRSVAKQLSLKPFNCPVITVAGTNGKGSCVTFLEAILSAQGYRTCAYTSPHLMRYTERIRVCGHEVSEERLCSVFEQVEFARTEVPLTYFEFGTLAALLIFQASDPQVVILEVGLGGRLDAVNIVDADIALVTPIGLDHTDWLGTDRESIGLEKAGIFRQGQAVVCGDPDPPLSLLRQAADIDAAIYRTGQDFNYSLHSGPNQWSWQGRDEVLVNLPKPNFGGDIQVSNAAACIASLRLLPSSLPVNEASIRQGLEKASLAGRFQTLMRGQTPVILDVAHNTEACGELATSLAKNACRGRTLAVVGMLRDKPARSIAHLLDAQVHAWYLGELKIADRGQTAVQLAAQLGPLSGKVSCHGDVVTAFECALSRAQPDDRIVVFGSFHTVEAVLGTTE